MTRSKTLYYETSHKCTDGHFSDNPIIPGAMLLSEVALFCEDELEMRITDISKVKFTSPLKPTEKAELTLERANASLKFSITKGDSTVLSGKAKLEAL